MKVKTPASNVNGVITLIEPEVISLLERTRQQHKTHIPILSANNPAPSRPKNELALAMDTK